jgi:Ca-activated chloride channel homolog
MLERVVAVALSLATVAATGAGAKAQSGLTAATPETQTEMTIRKTVGEVRLGFHVSSRNGRPVPGLQKDQFAVYQDGKPVTAVTGFYADDHLPLRLVLMIDASDSMSKGFLSEREAASTFLRRVVRPGVDQSAVVAFATHAALDLDWDAASPETLRRIEMLHSAGLTALFDSICDAAARMPAYDRQPDLTRRVLVLLSDGDDTYSRQSLEDAIAAAQRSDLVVYAVTAHNRKGVHWGDANLEKLTAATGGRVFFLKKYEQSEKVFADIEQEIRSQYTVTFRPAGSTCGFHSVVVEPADRSLRARARAGFYGDCW